MKNYKVNDTKFAGKLEPKTTKNEAVVKHMKTELSATLHSNKKYTHSGKLINHTTNYKNEQLISLTKTAPDEQTSTNLKFPELR